MYVVNELCITIQAVCLYLHPGGTSDLIGGFADFSSPAASASLPTSTGKFLCQLLIL